jgi:hypothetical protein
MVCKLSFESSRSVACSEKLDYSLFVLIFTNSTASATVVHYLSDKFPIPYININWWHIKRIPQKMTMYVTSVSGNTQDTLYYYSPP